MKRVIWPDAPVAASLHDAIKSIDAAAAPPLNSSSSSRRHTGTGGGQPEAAALLGGQWHHGIKAGGLGSESFLEDAALGGVTGSVGGVQLQPGDYVAVRVTGFDVGKLLAVPLARTSIREFAQMCGGATFLHSLPKAIATGFPRA